MAFSAGIAHSPIATTSATPSPSRCSDFNLDKAANKFAGWLQGFGNDLS
jgi:hypothetical protein